MTMGTAFPALLPYLPSFRDMRRSLLTMGMVPPEDHPYYKVDAQLPSMPSSRDLEKSLLTMGIALPIQLPYLPSFRDERMSLLTMGMVLQEDHYLKEDTQPHNKLAAWT